MIKITVDYTYIKESGMWIGTSPTLKGLNVEAETLSELWYLTHKLTGALLEDGIKDIIGGH